MKSETKPGTTEVKTKCCAFVGSHNKKCFLPAEEDTEFCILHLRDEAKDPKVFDVIFQDEIKKQSETRKLDLEGYCFPVRMNFAEIVGTKPISINLQYATFFKDAIFSMMRFIDCADFTKTIFESRVDFYDTTFSVRPKFSSTEFHDYANFRNATFRAGAEYYRSAFHDFADFYKTSFENDGTDFYLASFAKTADFDDAKFFDEAKFSHATFVGKALFRKSQFKEAANFSNVIFGNLATFDEANFCADANFGNSNFTEKLGFRKARFQQRADFTRAIFYAKCDFTYASFDQNAVFKSARMDADEAWANFARVRFNGKADFANVVFRALFSKTNFSWGTSFKGAVLRKVEFRSTNLQGCLFAHSIGLEDCRFANVSWAESSNHHWIVADEEELARKPSKPSTEDLGIVERIYRELKVNYEAHKNFPDAGHFHYGEMQMRRFAKSPRKIAGLPRRTILSLEGWYWLLSGYGERPWRAMTAFLLVIIGFAAIYSGLDATKVWEKLILSARIAMLRANVFDQTSSLTIQTTMLVETVLGPLTLGLFALAVRRRLRRN